MDEPTTWLISVFGGVRIADAAASTQIGRGRARELLCVLVSARDRPLSTEAVVDALWDGEPPPTASTIVHGLIRRLRGALGSDVLSHDGDGYRLNLAPGDVDLWTAQDAIRDGDRRIAQALWSEPVFGPYEFRPWARTAMAAMAGMREHFAEGNGPGPQRPTRPPTRLIGRAHECTVLRSVLNRERIVTIVGLGGVGKSRIAREVTWDRPEVFMADLGAGSGSVSRRIADDMGLAATGDDRWDRQAIVSVLRRGSPLLLVDGCENDLVGAADVVEYLRGQCPELSILATSRTALGVPGEKVIALMPFADPAAHNGDSVTLLIERAGELGVPLGGVDRQRLGELCAATGGVPLAIELAVTEAIFGTVSTRREAGEVAVTATPAMSPSGAVERAVDQAIGRLTDGTASTIQRLARFAHGFTPALLARVVGTGVSAPGVLYELHATGLIAAPFPRRLALFDPVREVLVESADEQTLVSVTAALGDVFGMVRPDLASPISVQAVDLAMAELPNLAATLRDLDQADLVSDALTLATEAADTWFEAGHWGQGAAELTRLLDSVRLPEEAFGPFEDFEGAGARGEERVVVAPVDWAHAVRALVTTAATYASIRDHYELLAQASRLASELEDRVLESYLAFGLTVGAGYGGDLSRAMKHYDQMRSLAIELQSDYALALHRHLEGLRLLLIGDPESAAGVFVDAANSLVALEALSDAARALRLSGHALRAVGALDDAYRNLKRAESLAVEAHAAGTLSTIRSDIVDVRHARGDLDRHSVEQALETVRAVGNLRAAGLLEIRLGMIDNDPSMLAGATLDLMVSDPISASVALAELVEVLPRRHRLRSLAPTMAARLRESWGTPLGVSESALVDRLCERGGIPNAGASEDIEEVVQEMLRALASRRLVP